MILIISHCSDPLLRLPVEDSGDQRDRCHSQGHWPWTSIPSLGSSLRYCVFSHSHTLACQGLLGLRKAILHRLVLPPRLEIVREEIWAAAAQLPQGGSLLWEWAWQEPLLIDRLQLGPQGQAASTSLWFRGSHSGLEKCSQRIFH